MTQTSKRDLMVLTWRQNGATRVGKPELRQIQRALRKHFGDGVVQSPASIARVLADEGAELKHPEIIEFDAQWRELQIKSEAKKFETLDRFVSSERLTLKESAEFIGELERLRLHFEREGDQAAVAHLVRIAADQRRRADAFQADRTVADDVRRGQSEIAEWLKVWLQTPMLFLDWVELRKQSPEFKQHFGEARF
jgi:hypothetical protein